VAGPLLVSALRATGAASWSSDLAVVRTLGLVPLGGEGAVSTILGQIALLLPLGGRSVRMCWVGAVATALCGFLSYLILRRCLEVSAIAPRLAPPIAVSAVLTATLGTAWQSEAVLAGGASVAAAPVLAAAWVDATRMGRRRWLASGALAGIAAAESHAAGLLVLAALCTTWIVRLRLPSRADLLSFCAAFGVMIAWLLSPLILRVDPDHAFLQLDVVWLGSSLTGAPRPSPRADLVTAWLSETGPVVLGLGAAGLLWGLLQRRTRPWAAAWLAFVAGDALFGGSSSPASPDPFVVLRLLAVSAVAAGAALAVFTAALTLIQTRVPFAEPAAVLLVVFHLTLSLSTADRAASDSAEPNAAEIWTDEALSSLPQGSLVLARSQAIVWRLWAARLARGQRPDVIVVPLPLLAQGNLAGALLTTEQRLAPLIRDVSIQGKPSEYALSTLADARPLYVELDVEWDRRLLEHLRPRPLWLAFAPHALGRSDRAGALPESRRAFRRVLKAAAGGASRDEATLSILGIQASEQAGALAALGDREGARRILEDLRAVDPGLPIVERLERGLASHAGRLDLRQLID
jgi:hypothetical protein